MSLNGFKILFIQISLVIVLNMDLEVNAQSCPSILSQRLTTEVNAVLVNDSDGVTLLGIRVFWTVKPEYVNCQYRYLRGWLYTYPNVHDLKSVILTHGTSSHFFDDEDLLCNEHYQPRITYRIGSIGVGDQNYQLRLFYGGSSASAPSQLTRVCARRSIGGVNISWDALPCHHQNGADITYYVIQHHSLRSAFTDIILSTSKSDLHRVYYESGANRYSYQIPLSTFLDGTNSYTFQVTAKNSYGQGPFSASVIYRVSYAAIEHDYITNGVRAELITDVDEVSLLGIRVLWTVSSVYLSSCKYPAIRVELNPGSHIKEATVNHTSVDFLNLECNSRYTALVRTIADAPEIDSRDISASLIYGGSSSSVPSQISDITIVESQATTAAVNISWNLLPCLLQNGADITGYIIQYRPSSGGEAKNLSVLNSFDVICDYSSDSHYYCLLSYMLFHSVEYYTFQVAATNRYGVGSFSNPVQAIIDSPMFLDTQFTKRYYQTTNHVTVGTSMSTEADAQLCSMTGFIVAGVLTVFVMTLGGVIITALISIIYILNRRLKKTVNATYSTPNVPQPYESISMKPCSAYCERKQLPIYETAS